MSTDNSSDDERKSQHVEDESEASGSDYDDEDFPDVEELAEILDELQLKQGSREKKEWINEMVDFYTHVEPVFENDERIIRECLQWLKKC